MSARSNAKGNAFERLMLDYLRDELGAHLCVPKAGEPHDRGDIVGIPNWTLELKNYSDTTAAIRIGLAEVAVEQANAETSYGAAIIKRKGIVDPAEQLVVMTAGQLVRLMRESAAW